MIIDKDFLKKLRSSFELNEYEVKIWTALLSKGIAAAGELSGGVVYAPGQVFGTRALGPSTGQHLLPPHTYGLPKGAGTFY